MTRDFATSFLVITAAMVPPALAASPITPEVVFDQARAYYRGNPAPERIQVRVWSQGQTRSEPIHLRFKNANSLFLDFGQYRAWSDGKQLWVAHRLDERGYFQSEVQDGGIAAALASSLPPLPLPQIAFAGTAPWSEALTPYTSGVRWTETRVESIPGPEQFVVSGHGPRVRSEIAIDANTGRVIRMKTELDEGDTRIELDVSILGAEEWPENWPDLSRRERVNELSELRPRPGDLRIGDPLTDLALMTYIEAGEIPVQIEGPGVAVLFRRWTPGNTPVKAIRAASVAVDGLPGVPVVPILVLTVLDTERRARIDAVQEDVAPLRLFETYSPEASIERFSSVADQVLVVIDSSNIVREIIVLPEDPETVDEQAIEAAVRRSLVSPNPKIKD